MRSLSFRPVIGPAALSVACFLLQFAIPWLTARSGADATRLPAAALLALAGIGAWLSLAWTGARLFDLFLLRAEQTTQRDTPYPRLLSDMVRAVLFAASSVAILMLVFNQSALGLLTTSGVVVAVIGFALRNIIGDLFSGLVFGIDAPYHIGDWIETAEGCAGRVTELSWRVTRLVTREGVELTVPNGLIAAHRLMNYGAEGRYRVNLRLQLDPSLPVERAKRILLGAALDAERRFSGLSADVLLQDFAESTATYLLRFYVPGYGQEAVCRDAVAAAVLRAMQYAGVTLARPGRAVQFGRAGAVRSLQATLLEHIPLFAGFPSEERTALEVLMQERLVARGAVIVQQGEAGDSLFLLAEGVLEVRSVRDGMEMSPDRMVPGDVFGEMSLLTGQPRSATVTAMTEALIFELRREHLDPILHRRPELAESLAAILADRQARNAQAANRPAQHDKGEVAEREDLLGRLRAFFRLA